MILTFIISAMFSVLLVITKNEPNMIQNKNYEYCKIFHKAASFIYRHIHKSIPMDKMETNIKTLKPLKWKQELKEFYVGKIGLILLILFVGHCFMWFFYINSILSPILKDGSYIIRNPHGKGNIISDVVAYSDAWNGGKGFTLSIGERQFSENEVIQIFDEISEKLESVIKGDNFSLDRVTSNLNLVSQIKGYPVSIVWSSNNLNMMNTYGEIQEGIFSEEGTIVTLTADLKYFDYQAQCTINANIYPMEMNSEEKMLSNINQELKETEKETRERVQFDLPDQVNDVNIIWRQKNAKTAVYILILAIVSSIAIYLGRDKEINEMIQRREKEMLLDYPEIVSKLTVLLSSGMTLFSAWKKIVDDYIEKGKSPQFRKRFAYEEMTITYHEIMGGIAELAAYNRFSKRSGIKRYRKLCSLLVQNQKKGSQGLSRMLENEAFEAFEERKRIAIRTGEEAETKLLFPMMLMLFVVIVIMIVPAFMTFQF